LRRGDCEISILHDKLRYFYDENSSCGNDLRGGDGNICTDRTSMNAEEVQVREEKTTVSSSSSSGGGGGGGGGGNNNKISNNRSTATKWTMRSNDNKRRRIFKEISFLKDLSPKPMPQSHSTTRSPRTAGQDIDSVGDIDGFDGPISRDPAGRFTDGTRHHKVLLNKELCPEEEEEEEGSDGKGSSDHRDRSFTLSGM
jgi:hypothetical protein